jgi:hypothetical protein
VQGLGGAGKHEMIFSYFLERIKKYKIKLWFDSVKEEEFKTQYDKMLSENGLTSGLQTEVKKLQGKHRCLLVLYCLYSNYHSLQHITQLVPEENTDIIIISRIEQEGIHKDNVIRIDKMSSLEAENLVENYPQKNSLTKEQITHLIMSCYCFPLMIMQAITFSAKAFLEQKEQKTKFSLLRWTDYKRAESDQNIIDIIKDAVKHSKEQFEKLKVLSLLTEEKRKQFFPEILYYLSLETDDSFTEEKLENIYQKEYKEKEMKEIIQSGLSKRHIEALLKFGLVVTNETSNSYQINTIVKDVIRNCPEIVEIQPSLRIGS